MQPLKSFQNKPPSNPQTFEQERPQKPGGETVSTLHWSKNDILSFFNFLQKKVFRLDKKVPAHFCINLGVVIWKNHVAKHLDSFNKCLLSSQETCFCRNLKNDRMSFLDQCNVEAASLPGTYSLSCSKVKGFEGSLFQKLFKGYIFCFLGVSIDRYVFEQFALETNLKKKRSVKRFSFSLAGISLKRAVLP